MNAKDLQGVVSTRLFPHPVDARVHGFRAPGADRPPVHVHIPRMLLSPMPSPKAASHTLPKRAAAAGRASTTQTAVAGRACRLSSELHGQRRLGRPADPRAELVVGGEGQEAATAAPTSLPGPSWVLLGDA